MVHEIYHPSDLSFQNYIAVCQCARVLADGYDRKDKARLRACLTSEVVFDYGGHTTGLGRKTFTADDFVDQWLGPTMLGRQIVIAHHLLGIPLFKSVTEEEIVVEWQQLASHGRTGIESGKIEEVSRASSWMQQTFVKTKSGWRISVIRPEVLFRTGDFEHVWRQESKCAK